MPTSIYKPTGSSLVFFLSLRQQFLFIKTKATTKMGGIELIDGAGHWIQQEQPVRLSELLLAFMKEVGGAEHASG